VDCYIRGLSMLRSENLLVAIALVHLLLVWIGALVFSSLKSSASFSPESVSFEDVLSWAEL
jgi:hypothetical protein